MPVYYMILVGYIIKFVICMALIKKKNTIDLICTGLT